MGYDDFNRTIHPGIQNPESRDNPTSPADGYGVLDDLTAAEAARAAAFAKVQETRKFLARDAKHRAGWFAGAMEEADHARRLSAIWADAARLYEDAAARITEMSVSK